MAEQLASLAISVKTGDVKSAIKELDRLEKSGLKAERGTDKLTESFKSVAKSATVAYVAYKTLSLAYEHVIKNGFAYNKLIEEQVNGLKTLAVATSSNVDSMGNTLDIMEKYTLAGKEANKTFSELRKINAETPHTLGQTAQIYKAMYPSMKNVGATTKELISLTKTLSIASGAAGIEFNSLLAGVDGLATGSVLVNSDLGRLLKSLNLTNKALKESDNVTKLVSDTFKDFKGADTMAVSVSNLANAWDSLTGAITSDAFESSKGLIDRFASGLENLNSALKDYRQNISTTADIRKITDVADITREIGDLEQKIVELRETEKASLLGGLGIKTWSNARKKAHNEEISNLKKLITLSKHHKVILESTEPELVAKDAEISDKQKKLNIENALTLSQLKFDLIAEEWDEEEKRATNFLTWQQNAYRKNQAMDAKTFEIFLAQRNKAFADSTKKDSLTFSESVSKNLETEIQSAFSNIRDFDDFTEALGSAVTSALSNSVATSISGSISDSISGSLGSVLGAVGGGVAGALVGSLASSLFGGSDSKSNEEIAQERFNTFMDSIDKASKSLSGMGNVGTDIGMQITSLKSKIIENDEYFWIDAFGRPSMQPQEQHVIESNLAQDELNSLIAENISSFATVPEGATMQELSAITGITDLEAFNAELSSVTAEISTQTIALKQYQIDLGKAGTSAADITKLSDAWIENSELASLLSDETYLTNLNFEDFISEMNKLSETAVESTDKMAMAQRVINSEMLGSLSYLSEAGKLQYANNIFQGATSQEDRISSSRSIAELSKGQTRTREEYAPIWQQYINELQKQGEEKTLTDIYDKLDEVVESVDESAETISDATKYAS